MKKAIILFLILIVSCKSGLEKKYSKSSKENDLIEISEQITSQDLKILTDYIAKLETEQQSINGTYKVLLGVAQYEKSNMEMEIDEKNRKKIKKEKDSIFKVDVVKKIELLCAHKWRMKEYSFVIETSEELSGIKMKDEVFINEDKGWKKYSSDGTFKTDIGRIGTWEFITINKIRETSKPPSGPGSIGGNIGKEKYFLEITMLDKNTFKYIEVVSSFTLTPGARVKVSKVMKAI